jgi:hypothetical protein
LGQFSGINYILLQPSGIAVRSLGRKPIDEQETVILRSTMRTGAIRVRPSLIAVAAGAWSTGADGWNARHGPSDQMELRTTHGAIGQRT